MAFLSGHECGPDLALVLVLYWYGIRANFSYQTGTGGSDERQRQIRRIASLPPTFCLVVDPALSGIIFNCSWLSIWK
jgi:hypothetical protein